MQRWAAVIHHRYHRRRSKNLNAPAALIDWLLYRPYVFNAIAFYLITNAFVCRLAREIRSFNRRNRTYIYVAEQNIIKFQTARGALKRYIIIIIIIIIGVTRLADAAAVCSIEMILYGRRRRLWNAPESGDRNIIYRYIIFIIDVSLSL